MAPPPVWLYWVLRLEESQVWFPLCSIPTMREGKKEGGKKGMKQGREEGREEEREGQTGIYSIFDLLHLRTPKSWKSKTRSLEGNLGWR